MTQPKHRLLRLVDTLPGNTVCQYDQPNNLVVIDRQKYDSLAKYQREMVINTQSDMEGIVPDTAVKEGADTLF